MVVDLDPLAYAFVLAREAAHNAPIGATGGAGGPHIALHRADMAWQAIGCRVLAVAPETPTSDLVGLAARGQADRPALRLDNGTAWPDPAAVADAFDRIPEPASMWRGLDDPRTPEERQAFADYCLIREALIAYDHLARHPAGTESMVQSLRSLRRAVAGRARA